MAVPLGMTSAVSAVGRRLGNVLERQKHSVICPSDQEQHKAVTGFSLLVMSLLPTPSSQLAHGLLQQCPAQASFFLQN